ncbi:MAG: hypothetical protein DME85_13790, partial [Verrucomicrobia bacterium]
MKSIASGPVLQQSTIYCKQNPLSKGVLLHYIAANQTVVYFRYEEPRVPTRPGFSGWQCRGPNVPQARWPETGCDGRSVVIRRIGSIVLLVVIIMLMMLIVI